MLQNIKKYFTAPVVYVVLVLLCFYPYVFNTVLHLGSETVLLLFFFAISVFCVLKGRGGLPPLLTYCLVIQILVWILYAVLHGDTSYITRVFFILMSSLLLIFLIRRRELIRFTYAYNQFIAIQALLGVPVFFLVALGQLRPQLELAVFVAFLMNQVH